MAIDARIPLGVQPLRIDSPLETAGQAIQLQTMQQQRQLYGMKMAEAQRQAAEQGAIREAFKASGGDLAKSAEALQAQGLYEPALKLRASLAEQAKARADADKLRVETTKARFDLQKNVMSTGFQDPSDQGIARMGGVLRDAGFPEESIQAMFADLTAEPDLDARKRKIMGFVRTPESLIDLYKPKFETIDDGQTKRVMDTNPLSNPDATQPIQMRMTPGQIATERSSAASRALTAAGQAETRRHNLHTEQNPRGVPFESGNGPILVNPVAGTSQPIVDGAGRPVPPKMSEAAKKEIDSLDAQTSAINGAIDAVSKTKSAFSMARGAATMGGTISESIAGRMDSDAERKARAYVFNNVSKIINERAGAAQSAQELARLRSFLPAETDGADQILSKLGAYKQFLAEQRQTYATPASQRGQATAEEPPAAAGNRPPLSSFRK